MDIDRGVRARLDPRPLFGEETAWVGHCFHSEEGARGRSIGDSSLVNLVVTPSSNLAHATIEMLGMRALQLLHESSSARDFPIQRMRRRERPEVSAVRFYVLLKGEGFTSHLGPLRPSVDEQPTKFGFLTTRVVQAYDAQQAVELATAQVRQDERIRDSSTGGIITPQEVHRVSWFFRRLFPPRGFTFFLEETEPDQQLPALP